MRIDKEFGTNKDAERNGVWVDMGGFKVKVCRLTTPAYQNRVRELGRPFRNRRQMSDADLERLQQIQRQAVSEEILVDWEGVEDADGPVAYSAEAGEEFFEKFPDFYNLVVEAAGDMRTFQDDEEADEGN